MRTILFTQITLLFSKSSIALFAITVALLSGSHNAEAARPGGFSSLPAEQVAVNFFENLSKEIGQALKKADRKIQETIGESTPPAPEETPRTQTSPQTTRQADNWGTDTITRDEIQEVQHLLNALGYNAGPVDGDYGPTTAKAILAYQRSNQLPANGLASKALIAHLQTTYSERRYSPRPIPESARQEETTANRNTRQETGVQSTTDYTATTKAQASGPQPAVSMHEISAPAGQKLIQLPLPDDFKPIRLIALNGLPVLGYPVSDGFGVLNPRKWPDARKNPFDLDAEWRRLLTAILLKQEPQRLKGIQFVEEFARNNLNQEALQHFFMTTRFHLPNHMQFGRDEFERTERFREFLSRYEQPLLESLPKTPTKFIYVERMLLETYDEKRQAFPMMSQYGYRPGTLELRLSNRDDRLVVDVPKDLPIGQQEAAALMARLQKNAQQTASKGLAINPALSVLHQRPQREIFLGLTLTLDKMSTGRNRQPVTDISVRSIGVYEDQMLTRLIYEFPMSKKSPDSSTDKIMAMPLWPHLLDLYAMRDIDDYLNQEGIFASTQNLITMEQTRWQNLDTANSGCFPGNQRTIFEWANSPESLSGNALAEVMLNPEVDWSFLNQETKYGLTPDHCVEFFVFPRKQIDGREPGFVAREMASVYRRTLDAAIAKLPKTVYLTRDLAPPQYDHESGQLVFKDDLYSSSNRDADYLLQPTNKIEYLAPNQSPVVEAHSVKTYAPLSSKGLAFYHIPILSDRDILQSKNVMRPPVITHGKQGDGWRNSVDYFTMLNDYQGPPRKAPQSLALDRTLIVPRITMKPADAEKLLASQPRYGAPAMRAVIVMQIVKAEAMGPEVSGYIRARLDHVLITTSEGEQIAKLDATAFPETSQAYANAHEQELEVAKKHAAAEAAKKEKLAIERQQQQEKIALANEFAICDQKSASASARQVCYQTLCESSNHKEHLRFECYDKLREIQSAVGIEYSINAAQQGLAESNCQIEAHDQWKLTNGSDDFKQFIDACMKQAVREPYGPDLLGIRLGMKWYETEQIQQRELHVENMSVGEQRRSTKHAGPFKSGVMYTTESQDHMLATYELSNMGESKVGAVSRRIFFDGDAPSLSNIIESMSEKYGEPLWSEGRHYLWLFGNGDDRANIDTAGECAGIRTMLIASQWEQYPGQDITVDRAPLIVMDKTSRTHYGKYADCGVTLLARIEEQNKKIKDISLVLFDPGWLANLPGPVFQDEQETDSKLKF